MSDEYTIDANGETITANELASESLRIGLESALGQTGFTDKDELAERNHYEVFGWPRGDIDGWDEENWLALYLRNAYAKVVTDKPAFTTWRDNPIVKPRNGDSDSGFTDRVEQLARATRMWSYAERADRAAGIGQHGLLLIDTSDRKDAQDWEDDVREESLSSLDAITGFRPILEVQIEDINFGSFDDERWGKPVEYTLDLSEDVDEESQDDPLSNITVHWSRVIDVPATRLLDDDTFARPRMEPVLNNLLDIEKTMGAAAEAAYRAADYGLHINSDPTQVDLSDGAGDLAKELQRYEQDLQRYIRTQGTEINRLGGEIQDPSGIIENNLDAISAETGIPKKELRGNESGEVSGAEQDKLSYFGTIQERREQYATPHIVRSLIDRLISIGVLSRPDGGYEIEWPDLHELSESDRADIQQKRSSVIANVPGLVGQTALDYLQEGADALDEDSSGMEALPAEMAQSPTEGDMQANQENVPPQQAQTNAQRVLNIREKTDAMTDTGWERAKQLADGGELSTDVIQKMAQFKRHQSNTEYDNYSDIPESEKSGDGAWWQDNGTVAWFGWGGTAGVEWAVEQSEELSGNVLKANETRYVEGGEVNTPDGPGVVVEIRESSFEGPSGSEVEASEASPTYIVGTQDGAETFKASEISLEAIETDIDNPEEELAEQRANYSANQETTFGIPDSWQESETPNRIILLKAWAGLGGRFTSCVREMRGELAGSPDRFCAAFKDRVLQWEGWRKGG